jgi:hypothetical protein
VDPPAPRSFAAALAELQDAPVDVANFFRAEPGAFGVFNEYGVPQANYSALLCFRRLLDCASRVAVEHQHTPNLWSLAGVNEKRDRASILIARTAASDGAIELRWPVAPVDRGVAYSSANH